MNQKQLWEELAKKNSRYYINSDKGKGITEEEFRESGKQDYITHVFEDPSFQQSGALVEIGCGNGRMTEFLAMQFEKVIGLDISGEMIRQAKERVKSVNVEFLETDGETMPIPDASVDYVFSYLVFQHMKTREMVEKNVKEAYRVLKPGGLFKVRLRRDEQKSMDPWWSGVHYSYHDAKDMASSAGFTVIKLEEVSTYGLWLWLKKP